MIVWLASYPRSGNTLLRQILSQAFGLKTYSRYNDHADIGVLPELAAATGHVSYQGSWSTFYARATASPKVIFVKTHDPPSDDAPAIYVVRDGRAAAVSWMHKMKPRQPQTPERLDDIIEGRTMFGGWSGHLDAWQVFERPRTVLLRFETLMTNPGSSIEGIGRFLALPQLAPFTNRRAELQRVAPGFVREGSNEQNIAELSLAQRSRFRELHGAWLSRLGYTA
jgi:hypothetical protein